MQRAQAVQEFLRANNLPSTLQSPVNFYTQQVSLYEQQSATFTLLGTRNSAALTVYNRKSEVISGGSGEALPPPFGALNNNTQRGASLAVSHRLTGLTSLGATVSRWDTTATAPFTSKTTTNYFVASAATRLSPQTDGFAGADLHGLRIQRHERLQGVHGVRRPHSSILSAPCTKPSTA